MRCRRSARRRDALPAAAGGGGGLAGGLGGSAPVGCIARSGVAVLDGPVMVRAIQPRLAKGIDPATAAQIGASHGLRTVAMTARLAGLGFVPMTVGHRAGAVVQPRPATGVLGGLIPATLPTSVVLPTLPARSGRSAR